MINPTRTSHMCNALSPTSSPRKKKKKKKKKSQEVQPCGPILPAQRLACPWPNVPILATQSTSQSPGQHCFPPLYLSPRPGLVCIVTQSRMPSPFSSCHSLPSPCSRLGRLSTARGPIDQPPEPISSPFSSLPHSLPSAWACLM